MAAHPIEGLMKTAMESIKEMVDVNTILGDPVETPDGSVILPVSRVSFGFAAGGSEFVETGSTMAAAGAPQGQEEQGAPGDMMAAVHPFGGGSGAGISVQPVAFLVVGHGQVRCLPVDGGAILDRIIDLAPQLLGQLQGRLGRPSPREVVTRPNVQGEVQ
ncbi:MAG TPA: sporulation protein YtfJ [Firmicutes bacterium]|nr:sporulation protein YtfJ [Bacillota bacterium]